MIAELFFALAAGVFSFVSPCVLPLVPVYISLMSGVSIQDMQAGKGGQGRIFGSAVAFVLGFSTIFILLGASATVIGSFLNDYQDVIARNGGILVIILALHLLGITRINFLLQEKRLDVGRKLSPGVGLSYVMGLVFAFGWTPCIGPMLASILLIASNQETVGTGIILLTVYSAGLGIPFLLVAAATGHAFGAMNALKRHFKTIEIASGALLLIVGLALVNDGMTRFSNAVSKIPFLAELETRISGLLPEIEGGDDFAIIAPTPASATNAEPFGTPVADEGIRAPMTTLDGQPANIADYRGKVVLLNYWAPWCTPCIKEMPMLSDLYRKLKDDGFVVLGMTLDYENAQQVQKIIDAREVVYPVYLGGREAANAVPSFQGFPANFLLDQNGNIVARRFGEFTDTESLEARVRELLGLTDS